MKTILSSSNTVYDRMSISKKFFAQETEINLSNGKISLLASASEIEELKNGDKTMFSRLSDVKVGLDSINLSISSSEYKDIGGVLSAVTQSKSELAMIPGQLALKVSRDNVVSSINISPEAVSIDAKKINLNGVVTANQNFKILEDGSMVAKNGTFNGRVGLRTEDSSSPALWLIDGTDELFMLGASITLTSSVSELSLGTQYIFLDSRVDSNKKTQMTPHFLQTPNLTATEILNVNGRAYIENLYVKGTKNRTVKTKSFGYRNQSSYETCEPLFGDLGHGIIGKCGYCIVSIDPVFSETVSTEYGYYVFLTKYGNGDVYVDEKNDLTFKVSGSVGMEFDWEIKAHQKGYETYRLEEMDASAFETEIRP